MSLASDSRKRAHDWFKVAEGLPPQQRQPALNIAEAWFRLAMDAEVMESHERVAATIH